MYSFWLRPEKRVSTRLDKIVKCLSEEQHTPLFPVHITLLGGIAIAEDVATETVHTLAECSQAFDIQLDVLETQQKYYQCLYIRAQLNQALIQLRNKALKALSMSETSHYQPHLSLIYADLPESAKRKIMCEPVLKHLPDSLRITHIETYETTGPPEQWRCIESVILKD